jgi:hypothetical protein
MMFVILVSFPVLALAACAYTCLRITAADRPDGVVTELSLAHLFADDDGGLQFLKDIGLLMKERKCVNM